MTRTDKTHLLDKHGGITCNPGLRPGAYRTTGDEKKVTCPRCLAKVRVKA